MDHGYVKLLDYAGSDRDIVRHARTSTGNQEAERTEEEDKKLLFYLYRNRHTSPFEMAKIWVEVHLPIFVWRQWARHRTQNMNEISGRYSELPNVFYIPTEWRRQAEKNKQSSVAVPGGWNPQVSDYAEGINLSEFLRMTCCNAYKTYEQMLEMGVAKEMARMVLPVNIYTKMHCCFDLHNLLGFIRLRDDAHAQSEIQMYGRALGLIVMDLFPWTWEAYRRYPVKVVDALNQEITDKAGVYAP